MSNLPRITIDESPALFLDFDGTLVDIVERPDLARVTPQLIDLLEGVYRGLGGALAIVTGRPLADLDRMLAPLALPAAGIHGIEHRNGRGRVELRCRALVPEDIRDRLEKLAASDSRLILEDKGYSLGLHYRQAPELETALRAAFDDICVTLDPDFSVQNGKMVFELRPTGIDKGSAIEKFMTESPFSGRRAIYIGDDRTDEDAFAVVNRLHGYSARVGEPDPESGAKYTLDGIPAVHAWLQPLTEREPK